MTDCNICKLNTPEIIEHGYGGKDGRSIECPQCGKYEITGSAEVTLTGPNMKLAAWVRDQNERGITPTISTDTTGEIKQRPDTNITDKFTILLRAIERRTKYPGFTVDLNLNNDFPLAWATCADEFHYLIESLESQGHIILPSRSMGPTRHIVISPKGWEFLSSLANSPAFADQAFVAMWFDSQMDNAWEQGIKPAIELAGYHPIRVDKELHVDRIDAKIVADIKDSRFLIADVTGQRAGVYFEAGFAIGLGRPVIWCVRKDELKSVHFDTRQYNHIVWGNPEELREKLFQLVRAVVGVRSSQ